MSQRPGRGKERPEQLSFWAPIWENSKHNCEEATADETIDCDLRTVPGEQQDFKGCVDISVP